MKRVAVRFFPTLFYMLGGLIVWAARFMFAYGVTGLACAKEWDASVVLVLVGGVSAVSLIICMALLAAAVLNLRRERAEPREELRPFVHWIAALVAGLAMMAILWETLPLAVVPICVSA
jgi:hypothetical protein